MYKRIAMSLNFYKFKERLDFKCKLNKVQLILTNGTYNNKFTDRILNCKYSIDRDINGSCNMLL